MGKCVLDQSVFSVFGQNGAIWIMCPLWAGVPAPVLVLIIVLEIVLVVLCLMSFGF